MTIDLSGKTALVTGGNRGLGLAVVQALAEAGARVTFTARGKDKIEEAMAALDGQDARGVVCDITDRPRLREVLREPYDILINNAGIVTPIGRLDEVAIEEVAQNFETNLLGAFHAAQLAVASMAGRGGGTIVNISSGAAHNPLEGWAAYCCGKAGLAMLTKMIHEEFGDRGVRVVGFAPGVVDTDMQGTIRASGINRVSQLRREDLAPAHEPARAIAFLCSDEASNYAGAEIDVRDSALRAAAGLAPFG